VAKELFVLTVKNNGKNVERTILFHRTNTQARQNTVLLGQSIFVNKTFQASYLLF